MAFDNDFPMTAGSVPVDASAFFFSRAHREALSALVDAVHRLDPVIVLTGPAGTGKTVVLEAARAALAPEPVRFVWVRDAMRGSLGIRGALAGALGLQGADETDEDATAEAYRVHFGADPRAGQVVLVIDDAHGLLDATLRYVSSLSQRLARASPPLQVVLAGRPEFLDRLRGLGLDGLRARVVSAVTVGPLSADEADEYLLARLRVLAGPGAPQLTPEARAEVLAFAQGLPGLIDLALRRTLRAGPGGRLGAARVRAALAIPAPARPRLSGRQRWLVLYGVVVALSTLALVAYAT